MQHAAVARLFGEARARQRRRRRAWSVRLSVGSVLAVVLVAMGYGTVRLVEPGQPAAVPGLPGSGGAPAVPASEVFSQAPYMGVRCPIANSIACDRVGLAIWLRRPAVSVSATIDGRFLVLNRFGDQLIRRGSLRTEFDGYLQPAGIRSSMRVQPDPGTSFWGGDGAPSPLVRVLVRYPGGRKVVTHLQVMLAAGWG